MNKTCVTFSKVNVSATIDEQHILFATDPSLTHGYWIIVNIGLINDQIVSNNSYYLIFFLSYRCESFVGKVTTNVIPQQIYLDYPGCLNAVCKLS